MESHEGYHTELGNAAQSSAELRRTHPRTVPLKARERQHPCSEGHPLLVKGHPRCKLPFLRYAYTA